MTDSFEKLSDITKRITGRLAPVTFMVRVDGTLAVVVMAEAAKCNILPETLIAEALRCYMGDAA
jgi:hypothetical protein